MKKSYTLDLDQIVESTPFDVATGSAKCFFEHGVGRRCRGILSVSAMELL
ncbi:MAG: hypothetical protein MK538_09355 [Planctomycetes bacterium]|nr:hypothetical protein [Planctomycetota bacterium]